MRSAAEAWADASLRRPESEGGDAGPVEDGVR
uniref:Uncharacterized protein n=1 Tax=Arundo donax TaxID=35708 RepID=A0A0A8YXZ3_ARUDO